ncbi:MAG: hypothetical protein PHE12_01315 [Clostridia bacterium]|nr:hypothetical protein [Clostridia bacterium]
MDIKNLGSLFTEFLDLFKGKNMQDLAQLLPNLGNSGALEKILKGKYIKYLPLLPILAKISQEGFKGLLNNSDDIKSIISVFNSSESSVLKDIDIESILKFLPVITQFFSKTKEKEQPLLQESCQSFEKPPTNPVGCIADIADKDIIYALNKYISRNTD